MEEKGSDVNLSAHLLNDVWKGLFDAAAVISNDTDLVTPIRMVGYREEQARLHRVSRALAGCAETETGGDPCTAYQFRKVKGGAVSMHIA